MASADVTAELRCSICREIYRDPVTLPCGHNFCRDCITQAWNHQVHLMEYKCPECQKIYRKRPELVRNTTLNNISEGFHFKVTDHEQTGVFCNYCDFPVPAVKTCLQCETSLCDHHLRKHDVSGGHTLLPPTTDLGKRKCSVHKKILEYYCTEDNAYVCVTCRLDGEHQGHQVVTLNETSKKKKKLKDNLQKMKAETEEAEERVQSLEERRRKEQEKADGETERVTALFRDLSKRLEDLQKRVLSDITRQAEKLLQSYDDIIRQLEIKKEELSRKMCHIEELCNMTDPLTVLQESDTGDLCDTEDRERHDKQLYNGGDLDVAGISRTLHTGVADIMSGVIYIYTWETADILLDENTAGNYLHISKDRKTVSRSDIWQDRPKTPERFQEYYQVLSSQSFSSGRHYWEVDVGGSNYWRVGMCYPSIDSRRGQCIIGHDKKSWGLTGYENYYSASHNMVSIESHVKIPSDRVRIYLDYEAGQISFYALCDPIRHLHTFTATFTEPLHAGLYVYRGCIKISWGDQMLQGGQGRHVPPPTDDCDPPHAPPVQTCHK